MAKSAIAMDAGEIAALENEDAAPEPEKKEPAAEPDKGAKVAKDDIEFVAEPEEPEEGEKPKKVDAKAKDDGKKGESAVPHKAFHAEREERKKAQAALREAQEKLARMPVLEDRVAQINAALSQRQPQLQPQPEADQVPDPNDDPVKALAWLQKQFLAQKDIDQRNAQEQSTHTASQQQAQQEWSQAYRAVNAQWEQAAAIDPQLNEAYQAVKQNQAAELHALGWRGQELANELNRIEAGYILHCYRNGIPIGQFVTSLASARAGWKPKPEEDEGEEPETVVDKQKAETAENMQKLQRLAKAQDASDTLSGMGGGATGNRISLETLDRMDNHEFNALVAKLSKGGEDGVDRALAKMMGIPLGRA